MTFLPANYEAPVSEGNYYKLKKGDNTFRILSDAITGFEYWNLSNKPVRSVEPWEEMPADIKPDSRVRHFWAFVVYNYDAKKPQILEITQKTIQEALEALVNNKKWGDPRKYDVVIKATGDGLEREYTVIPEPHTEAPNVSVSQINLGALFLGEDPFSSKAEPDSYPTNELRAGDVPF